MDVGLRKELVWENQGVGDAINIASLPDCSAISFPLLFERGNQHLHDLFVAAVVGIDDKVVE